MKKKLLIALTVFFILFFLSMIFLLAFSFPPPADFEVDKEKPSSKNEKVKVIKPSFSQMSEKNKTYSIVWEKSSISAEVVSIEAYSLQDKNTYCISKEVKVVSGKNQLDFNLPGKISSGFVEFIVRNASSPKIFIQSEAISLNIFDIASSPSSQAGPASAASSMPSSQTSNPPEEEKPMLSAQSIKAQGEEDIPPSTIRLFPFKPRFSAPGDKIFVQWKAAENVENLKITYSYDNFEKTSKDIKVVSADTNFLGIKATSQILGKTISFKLIGEEDKKVISNIESIKIEDPPLLKADFESINKNMKAGEKSELWIRAKDRSARYVVEGRIEEKKVVLGSGNLNSGYILLDIPNKNMRNVQLKVYSEDNKLEDISDPFFAFVTPGIEMLSPSYGQEFMGGDVVLIKALADSSIEKVKLEYSLDNFSKDCNLIISNVTNSSDYIEYNWTISPHLDGDVKIRITSLSDKNVYGEVTIKAQKIEKDKATAIKAGPSPFNPAVHGKINFEYVLPEDLRLEFYVFDISGQIVWKKQFESGQEGGKKGLNRINWNGQSVTEGEVPNGIYVFTLVANGKIMGKDKFAVFR